MTVGSCEFESHLLHLKLKLKRGIFVAGEWENLFSRNERSRKSQVYVVNAEIAQLVEHNLAKVGVASSSLVFRSRKTTKWLSFLFSYNWRSRKCKFDK